MKRISFLLAILMCFMLVSCGDTVHKRPDAGYLTKADLKDATIGIIADKTTEDKVTKNIENAKVTTYNNTNDAVSALKNGQIHALVTDRVTSDEILANDANLGKMLEPLIDSAYCVATYMPGMDANDDFTLEVGATLSRMQSDGSYDKLYSKYFEGSAPSVADFEYYGGKVEGRTLVVGIAEDNAPFSYKDSNGTWIGFDVEFANEIAKTWGAKLEIRAYPRAKLLNALNSGELKIALGRFLEIDKLENHSKVLLSLPYYDASQEIILVRENIAENPLKADMLPQQ